MQISNIQPGRLTSIGKSTLYNLAHVFTGNVLTGTISLISLTWFARVLGTEVMGDYAAILVGIQILTSLIVPGFNQAVIREPSRQEIVAAATLATILQCSIIMLIGAGVGLWVYWQDGTTFSVLLLPIILLLLSLIISLWSYLFAAPFEAGMDYQFLVKVRIISLLSSTLAGVGAAEAGYGIYALIIRDLVLSIIGLVLLRIYSPLPIMLHGWRKGIRSLMEFTKGLWGLNAMEKVILRIDYVFVGFLIGKDELGIYYAVRGLIEGVLGFVVSPIQTVIYSLYCRLHNLSELVDMLLGKGLVIALIAAISTIIGTIMVGHSIASALLGQSYEDGHTLLPGLVLYAFSVIWFENIKVLSLSQNRHNSMQLPRITQLGISIVLIFPLIRFFGLGGAGISAGLAAMAMAVMSTRLLIRLPSQVVCGTIPPTSRESFG